MTDLTEKTDAELHQLITDAKTILRRRESEREAGIVIDAEIRRHAQASGRNLEDGQPFVQPTGAHDAYPKGSIVTHDGKTWAATRAGANGTPGESPDWRRVAVDGESLPWEQRWAGSEYERGDEIHHLGRHWRSSIDRNGFEPGDDPHNGWDDLGPWPPEEPEPEDPEEPTDPEDGDEPGDEDKPEEPGEEEPDWEPVQAGGELPEGAIVRHNGYRWQNDLGRPNGFEPSDDPHNGWTNLGPLKN